MPSTCSPAELLGAAVCCAAHQHQACPAPPKSCDRVGRSASSLRPARWHTRPAHTNRPRRRVVAAAGPGGTMKAWPPADVWAEFTAFHEGAWDSTSCVFARDGAAVPLPEKYTPEAYKEWGQVMHEWQARVAHAAACVASRACVADCFPGGGGFRGAAGRDAAPDAASVVAHRRVRVWQGETSVLICARRWNVCPALTPLHCPCRKTWRRRGHPTCSPVPGHAKA